MRRLLILIGIGWITLGASSSLRACDLFSGCADFSGLYATSGYNGYGLGSSMLDLSYYSNESTTYDFSSTWYGGCGSFYGSCGGSYGGFDFYWNLTTTTYWLPIYGIDITYPPYVPPINPTPTPPMPTPILLPGPPNPIEFPRVTPTPLPIYTPSANVGGPNPFFGPPPSIPTVGTGGPNPLVTPTFGSGLGDPSVINFPRSTPIVTPPVGGCDNVLVMCPGGPVIRPEVGPGVPTSINVSTRPGEPGTILIPRTSH